MDMEADMRKRLGLYVIICVFLLSGCDFVGEKTPSFNEVISFANENNENIIDCSCFLLNNFATEDDAINITVNENGTMQLYSYHLERANEERIPELEPLFATNMIDVITLRSNAVEYSVGGSGIGSNMTYNMIIYIPSNDIVELFGYSDGFIFHFDESTGGFLGEKNGSDDTFFYYKIHDCLYYVITSF